MHEQLLYWANRMYAMRDPQGTYEKQRYAVEEATVQQGNPSDLDVLISLYKGKDTFLYKPGEYDLKDEKEIRESYEELMSFGWKYGSLWPLISLFK